MLGQHLKRGLGKKKQGPKLCFGARLLVFSLGSSLDLSRAPSELSNWPSRIAPATPRLAYHETAFELSGGDEKILRVKGEREGEEKKREEEEEKTKNWQIL